MMHVIAEQKVPQAHRQHPDVWRPGLPCLEINSFSLFDIYQQIITYSQPDLPYLVRDQVSEACCNH
jgi:hypothetical protein